MCVIYREKAGVAALRCLLMYLFLFRWKYLNKYRCIYDYV